MFGLAERDVLAGPVLDCPGGAGPSRRGCASAAGEAVCADPAYALPPDEIVAAAGPGWSTASATWATTGSRTSGPTCRRWTTCGAGGGAALEAFARDFAGPDERYVVAALPACPSPTARSAWSCRRTCSSRTPTTSTRSPTRGPARAGARGARGGARLPADRHGLRPPPGDRRPAPPPRRPTGSTARCGGWTTSSSAARRGAGGLRPGVTPGHPRELRFVTGRPEPGGVGDADGEGTIWRIIATIGVTLAVCAGPRRPRRGGTADADRAVRHLRRLAEPRVEGELVADLGAPGDPQAGAVAEIVQRNRPDVLLLIELDFVAGGRALEIFQSAACRRRRRRGQPDRLPLPVTTRRRTPGSPSGLRPRQRRRRPEARHDAFGFGAFPGQSAWRSLAYPIDVTRVRTFQRFLWKDMPGARLPDDPATPARRTGTRRRSSTSSGSRPRATGTCRSGSARGRSTSWSAIRPRRCSTAPEDRNGLRNADEIRFWADYLEPLGRAATSATTPAAGAGCRTARTS